MDAKAIPFLGVEPTGGERTYAEAARRRKHIVKQRKLRGGYSEIVACAWLLEQGYEVFRNVADKGFADLIAVQGSKCILIDVKTVTIKLGALGVTCTAPALKPHQIKLGIVPLYVTDEGICGWSTAMVRDKLQED